MNPTAIETVLRQTTYTEAEAEAKLLLWNNNPIQVIRDFMGIPVVQNKSNNKPLNLQQEIYKQIRTKMNSSMKEYNDKNPINVNKVIEHFNENEQNQNQN